MAPLYTDKRQSVIAQAEIKPARSTDRGVQFTEASTTDTSKHKPIQLFCYSSHRNHAGHEEPRGTNSGQWCDKEGTLRFLEGLPQEPSSLGDSTPCFTLIAGHGNGTLKPLSLDRDLFQRITAIFQLPATVRQVICSIHGVFVRFIQEESDSGKSLLIIVSTSKSPVREIFLAMQIRVIGPRCAVNCLLFDCNPLDLREITSRLMSAAEIDWRNPLAFLMLLVQDIGRTSEATRSELDLKILEAELKTGSTSWGSKEDLVVRWPEDSYQTMSALHICHNNLVFVTRAIEEEANAWRQLRYMAEDEKLRAFLKMKVGNTEETTMLGMLEFEIAYTESRKAQIRGLKERVEVQINLIHNMIAHQEASQTNLIAIVALVFAPASLIAGIFSAGIFQTDDRSWIAYLASTLPVTFVTVTAGLIFLEYQRIKMAGRAIRDMFRRESRRLDSIHDLG